MNSVRTRKKLLLAHNNKDKPFYIVEVLFRAIQIVIIMHHFGTLMVIYWWKHIQKALDCLMETKHF